MLKKHPSENHFFINNCICDLHIWSSISINKLRPGNPQVTPPPPAGLPDALGVREKRECLWLSMDVGKPRPPSCLHAHVCLVFTEWETHREDGPSACRCLASWPVTGGDTPPMHPPPARQLQNPHGDLHMSKGWHWLPEVAFTSAPVCRAFLGLLSYHYTFPRRLWRDIAKI